MNSIKNLKTLSNQLAQKAKTATLTKHDLDSMVAETGETENNIFSSSLSYPEPWQSSQYLHIQVDRIVELDNDLFAVTEDKKAVLPYCRLLHELNQRLLRNVNLSAYDDVPLSDSFRVMTSGKATDHWAAIRQGLEKQGCSPTLLDLCEKPLNLLAALHVRYRLHDHRYLEMYLAELEKVSRMVTAPDDTNPDPETPVIEALIRMDMNASRIFRYIAKKLNAAYVQLGSPEEQLNWLDEQDRYFGQFGLVSPLSYRLEGIGLLDELKGWVEDRLKGLWRASDEVDDERNFVDDDKVIVRNMKATEFSVFEKMLYELNLTLERNLDTLAQKLADRFTSRGRRRLSKHSILKKFHVRDYEVKHTIKDWLKEMDQWLDRNMN